MNQRLESTPANPRPGQAAVLQDGSKFVTVLGVTYFVADHPSYGTELFRSKGTAATTRLAADINLGSRDSNPRGLMTDGYRLFFSANDGTHGRELWMAEPLFDRVTMVKDIAKARMSSSPTNLIHFNRVILFQAADWGDDFELWRTDGTAKNTYRVADLAPGNTIASRPQNFRVFQNRFFFHAGDGKRYYLWSTDGTAKGTLRYDVGVGIDRPTMAEYRGELYFTASRPNTGLELFKLGPEAARPVLVHDVLPGSADGAPNHLQVLAGRLWFAADGRSSGGLRTGVELHSSDGTTLALYDLMPGATGSRPEHFVRRPLACGDQLFFVASGVAGRGASGVGKELWRIDRTGVHVLDLLPGGEGSQPRGLTIGPGGDLYFAAWSPPHGSELWRSDGTLAGSHELLRIDKYDSVLGSQPSFLTPSRKHGLLFACDDGPHGTELWKSDGTAQGTKLVADLNPQTSATMGSRPVLLGAVDGLVYFSADAGSRGAKVYSTDGSAAGTFPVIGLQKVGLRNASAVASNAGKAFVVGDGQTGAGTWSGQEIWVVDQATGAVTLLDIRKGRFGSFPLGLTVYKGKVFFSAIGDLGMNGAQTGRELWCTDGTVRGTSLLKDLIPGRTGSNPEHFFVWKNKLYFAARDELDGVELFVTDGTRKGYRMVRDIAQGAEGSDPYGFVSIGDKMAFVATTRSSGTELVVTDGTMQGTKIIDTLDGPASGLPVWLIKTPHTIAAAGGKVFFASRGKLNRTGRGIGYELWCSDGTRKGTRFLADLWTGWMGSMPGVMIPIGDSDEIAFVARVGTGAQFDYPGLFVTDGTAKGTKLLRRLNAGWGGAELSDAGRFGARQSWLRLPIYDVPTQRAAFELILTDGTPSGTRSIVNDVMPARGNAPAASVLVDHSGQLFVTRVDKHYGMEVYVTSGHAISQPVGVGCGFGGPPPRLTSNDPLIGMPVHPTVSGPPSSLGMLMVGMWNPAGLAYSTSCRIHVDLFRPRAFFAFATDATGRWRGGLRSNGASVGYRYAIQAAVADTRRTGTTRITNPVVMRAGTR